MGCGASRANAAQPDPGAVAFAGAPPANAPAAPVQEPTAEQQVEIDMVEAAVGTSAPAPASSSVEPTVSQQANADKEEAAAAARASCSAFTFCAAASCASVGW